MLIWETFDERFESGDKMLISDSVVLDNTYVAVYDKSNDQAALACMTALEFLNFADYVAQRAELLRKRNNLI